MKIDNKEYEEISEEDAYTDSTLELLKEGVIEITTNEKVRYFREVKPAPEFPIKIELSDDYFLLFNKNKSIIISDGDKYLTLISCEDFPLEEEKDINGILKALLYLLPEDDIIKKLKELR